MQKFSKNPKLNAVLNSIYEDVSTMSKSKIKRYMKSFPNEPDYNIAAYGNVLIYYFDIFKMYRRAGYTTTEAYSNQKIWKIYRKQVGYIARYITNDRKNKK